MEDESDDPESDDSEDNVSDGENNPLLAAFCGTKLKVTPIAGTNKVKAVCAGQALAYVFTQPKDELGNPVPFNQEQFPELLTGDDLIELESDASWFFYQSDDGERNIMQLFAQPLDEAEKPAEFSFNFIR